VLDKYFEPAFGKKLLGAITYEAIIEIVEPLPKSEKAHALAVLRTFLRWCVKPPRRYIPHSPLEGVEITLAKPRKRVLKDGELAMVWRAAGEQGYSRGYLGISRVFRPELQLLVVVVDLPEECSITQIETPEVMFAVRIVVLGEVGECGNPLQCCSLHHVGKCIDTRRHEDLAAGKRHASLRRAISFITRLLDQTGEHEHRCDGVAAARFAVAFVLIGLHFVDVVTAFHHADGRILTFCD